MLIDVTQVVGLVDLPEAALYAACDLPKATRARRLRQQRLAKKKGKAPFSYVDRGYDDEFPPNKAPVSAMRREEGYESAINKLHRSLSYRMQHIIAEAE
jgi:hypothetical protein